MTSSLRCIKHSVEKVLTSFCIEGCHEDQTEFRATSYDSHSLSPHVDIPAERRGIAVVTEGLRTIRIDSMCTAQTYRT